jgi:hypothetical protein
LGLFFAIALLLYGLVFKNTSLERAGYVILMFVAIITIPVFLSREGAEEVVEKLSKAPEELIERHEELAKFALAGAIITGIASALALLSSLRKSSGVLGKITLLLAVVSFLINLLVANYGGKIGHPEIRNSSSFTDIEED